jgi:hypothetical protein
MTRPAGIPDEFWTLLDAACDGALGAADQARLEAYLSSSPDAHRAFVNHIRLRSHVRLWWKGERSRRAGLDRVAAAKDERPAAEPDECGMMHDELPWEPPTPAASPIHHSSFIIHHFGHPSFFVLASYLAAALILGAAAINAWLWSTSASHVATGLAAEQLPANGEPLLVGRVTVTNGCRPATGDMTADSANWAAVFLGRKFELESGLLEIVYKSGWQVILQGPATFQVDSGCGGFLSAGKLTARWHPADLGIGVPGGRAQASGPAQFSSFALRTPTATITSPAGEMGIEVRPPQVCRVCVFNGQAELRSNGNGGDGGLVERLGENQSAEAAQVGARPIVRRVSQPEFAARFARRIARPVFANLPAPDGEVAGAWLKSIGPELTQGQLIAIGSGKDIELPGASSPGEKRGSHGAQTARVREGTGGLTFTSHQVFEVNDVALDTALVQGWFVAQGHVSAVRFNGKSLTGLLSGDGPGTGSGGFVVGSDLVRRVNTLEIDVSGVMPPSPQNNSLMWLRLRVSGIRLPGQKAPPVPGRLTVIRNDKR